MPLHMFAEAACVREGKEDAAGQLGLLCSCRVGCTAGVPRMYTETISIIKMSISEFQI